MKTKLSKCSPLLTSSYRDWSMEKEVDIALQMEETSLSVEDKCKSEASVFQEDEITVRQIKKPPEVDGTSQKKDNGAKSEMEDCESEVSGLQREMRSLQQELGKCQIELKRVQKQLDQSLRLQRSTESFNNDLRQQVTHASLTSNMVQGLSTQVSV